MILTMYSEMQFIVHGPGIAGASTALAAAVVLPRYRGYITRVGLMKIQKGKKNHVA